jgi:hypothetical protein
MSSQETLLKDIQNQMMSMGLGGIKTGNPTLDGLLSQFLGGGIAPVPGAGQSVLDAYKMRSSTKDQLALMRESFGKSMLGQHLGGVGGFNTNSMIGSMAAQTLGMSGLMDTELMQAMNGGNPVRALMGLKANMTGLTMGQQFGSPMNADNNTVLAAFRGIQSQVFKQKTITSEDIDKEYKAKTQALFKGFKQEDRDRFKDYISTVGGEEVFDYNKFGADAKSKTSEFDSKAKAFSRAALNDEAKLKELKKDSSGNEAEIKTVTESLKKNTAEFDKLQKAKSDYVKDLGEALKTTDSVADLKNTLGEKLNVQTNQQSLRGYRIQDVTKTYAMAMDLNMTSLDPSVRNSNATTEEKARLSASGYAKNAMKVLRAVSDTTGAEDSETAMSQLNSFIGNSKINLGTEEGSAEAEDLVRRFKASARTAGVGISAVMEILNTVKGLSAQHPELRYSNGTASMETTINAMSTTTALTSTMGGDWVRQNGGQAAVSQTVAENAASARAQPITKQLMGIVGLTASKGLGEEKQAEAMKALDDWANNRDGLLGKGDHDFSETTKGVMMARFAERYGISLPELSIAMDSTSSQTVGNMFADKNKQYNFTSPGEFRAGYQDFFQGVENTLSARGKSPDEVKEIVAKMKKEIASGKTLSEVLTANGAQSHSGYITEQMAADANLSLMVTTGALEETDPAYRKLKAETSGKIASTAKAETDFAKKMSHLSGPALDNIVQAWMGGAYGNSLKEVKNMFTTEKGIGRSTSIFEAIQRNAEMPTDQNFRDAMVDILGGADDAGAQQDMTDVGLVSKEEREKADTARKAWRDSDVGYEAFKKATANKDLSSLAAAYKKRDTITDEELSLFGISRDELSAAGQFLTNTGLDSEKSLSKYGRKNFAELQKDMTTREGLVNTTARAQKEMTEEALSTGMTNLKEYFYAKSDASASGETETGDVLGMLSKAGYLSLRDPSKAATLDNVDWSKGDGMLMYHQDKNDGISAELNTTLLSKSSTDIMSEKVREEDKQYLKDKGVITEKDGVVTWDEEKLTNLQDRRKAVKALAGNDYADKMSQKISDVQSITDGQLAKSEASLTAEQLKNMTTTLGTGAQGITAALKELCSYISQSLGK